MDGLTFLRKVMAERPTPVIICSTLAERGAQITLDALAAGAVSVITKPKLGLKAFLEDSANDIVAAIKAAASANLGALRHMPRTPTTPPPAPTQPMGGAMYATTDRLVAFGTSTGGTQALELVLRQLPSVCPGMVIVQHMPEKFTAMFAERLDGLCEVEVREARDGDRVRAGLALIAPGGRHMMVRRSGAQYHVEVRDGPLVNRHKPSVDVLFRSVAQAAGRNALGIIMTGMGDDGARGLREMRDAGATTVAQDEATCVVYGMPKEAVRLEAACRVMSLYHIPHEVMAWGR
jgi:two-component system chemotaxis response regulator CheB